MTNRSGNALLTRFSGLLRLLPLLIVFAVWQVASTVGALPKWLMPSFFAVIASLADLVKSGEIVPHTIASLTIDAWTHPYSRELAGYPASWLRDHKFWPSVGRIDNPYGDRNLVCSCPPMDASET